MGCADWIICVGILHVVVSRTSNRSDSRPDSATRACDGDWDLHVCNAIAWGAWAAIDRKNFRYERFANRLTSSGCGDGFWFAADDAGHLLCSLRWIVSSRFCGVSHAGCAVSTTL